MSELRVKVTFVVLILLLLISTYFCISIGAVKVEYGTMLRLLQGTGTDTDAALWQILLNIRMPRVFAALIVGGALSITGAVMQGLFRNPLVEPGIVGVMSGASFAATMFIVLGTTFLPAAYVVGNDYALPISAFLGAWIVTLLLYMFAKRGGVLNIASMLLIGIALGALTGALTGLLTYIADDRQLRDITFWGMGSLAIFDWQKLAILTAVCLFSLPILFNDSRFLNALMLGENVANHLGFNVEAVKKRQILLVALIVGTCVAFSGGIGFVGLVVPHIVRGLIGSNNNYVLPASFLFGASLLALSDLFARIVVIPAELPIGIITAIIGGPFLGFLVWKGSR